MHPTNRHTNLDQDANYNQLNDLLSYYKQFLTDKHTEVNQGQDLLKMGLKTEIVQDAERFLLNPLKAMMETKQVIDEKISEIIDGFVTFFITKSVQQQLIQTAFKKSGPSNALYYGITLKEDSFANREKVLHFLSYYNTLDVCDKVPVYFQFVPSHLVGNFKKVTTIA